MGSIEGVIILSSTNEPILHSQFSHPSPNYPILHADQFAAKIEAASTIGAEDILPITFAKGIAHHFLNLEDGGEDGMVSETEGEMAEEKTIEQTGSALVHIQSHQIRLAATFSRHLDPLLPITFLHNLSNILDFYLGTPITEDAIRDNFDIVYQILEEMLDESGQPLNTEYNTIRDLVREPNWINNVMGKMASMPGLGTAATSTHVSNIPWRRSLQSTPRTSRNEIYLDVVDVLKGSFSRGKSPKALPNLQLYGAIECNCKLGGIPDLTLGLSNAVSIILPSLHPCIRVKKWKKDKVFSFVPPDGRFTLAEYDLIQPERIEKQTPLSLKCSRQDRATKETSTFTIEVVAHTLVEGIEITFDVKERSCTFETKITGGGPNDGFGVGIPTEDLNTLQGSVNYDPKNGISKWSIGKIESNQKPLLLTGAIRSESSPRLSTAVGTTFTVPSKTLSGLKVTSLEIVNDVGYRPFKGVRNILKGDLDWRW